MVNSDSARARRGPRSPPTSQPGLIFLSEDVAHPAPKTYKACRHCRKQKMRCDGRGNGQCSKCRAAGVECRFDVKDKDAVDGMPVVADGEGRGKKRQTSRTSSDESDRMLPISSTLSSPQVDDRGDDSAELDDITANNMSAPISAIQAMTSPNRSRPSSAYKTNKKSDYFSAGCSPYNDVVDRGIIGETDARRVFDG